MAKLKVVPQNFFERLMFKDMYQHVCIFPPLSCVAFCQLHTHSDTDAGDNNNSYWHLSQL